MPIEPGALLGNRYLIQHELGRGSFGIVYLALDAMLHAKPVVIKFLLLHEHDKDTAWIRRKFDEEIRALAIIDHPGVVRISDAGIADGGVPYLVMDYIEGTTLRKLLDAGPLDLKRAAALLRQIGGAIAAAHSQRVVHRDLKPENVMTRILATGEEHVSLIDFGIASIAAARPSAPTDGTAVVGTIKYMAPEQFRGRPTPASDVYAMGVIAYETMTGRLPFAASTPVELYLMQQENAPADPQSLRPELPDGLGAVILRALRFAPEERPSAQEYGEAIAAAVMGLVEPAARQEQQRFLDVAMAKQIPVLKPAELVALVRLPGSEGLQAVFASDPDFSLVPEDVRSKPVNLEFPVDRAGRTAPLDLTLKIDAPDFEPPSQSKLIRVPPGADSELCTFLLTPRHLGELVVNVELYAGAVTLFSRVLKVRSMASDRLPEAVSKALVSVPLTVSVHEDEDEEAQSPTQITLPSPPPPLQAAPYVAAPRFSAHEAGVARQATQVAPPCPLPTYVAAPRRSSNAKWAVATVAMCLCIGAAITLWTQREERFPSTTQIAKGGPSPSPPAAKPSVTAVQGEVVELERRQALLETRVKALETRLERQKRSTGSGLPSDLAASHRRLTSFMDAAAMALRDRDTVEARAALDNAGQELDKLEKRLGR